MICSPCQCGDHEACQDGTPQGDPPIAYRCDCCCTGTECFDCRPLSAAQIAEIQADIRKAKEELREER